VFAWHFMLPLPAAADTVTPALLLLPAAHLVWVSETLAYFDPCASHAHPQPTTP
jgi:hypothetical protein